MGRQSSGTALCEGGGGDCFDAVERRETGRAERVDQATPPQRDAGAEIEAVFEAERLTRRPDWQELLDRSWLWRGGAISLFDAQLLGGDVPAQAKATLLGQALRMEHALDAVEREILGRLGKRLAVKELVRMLGDGGVEAGRVVAAIRSLVGRRLARLEDRGA